MISLKIFTRPLFLLLVLLIPLAGFSQTKKHKKKNSEQTKHFGTAVEYFDYGSDLLKHKKYKESIKYLDKAVAMDKTMYESFFNRGLCKFYLHDFEAALPDFTQSIKLYRKPFHEGLYFRGNCYAQLGKFDLAVGDFTKALDIASNEDLWSARGYAYLQLKNYENALSDYTYAIALNKSRIDNFGGRAVCNYNLHHLKEAIADAEVFLARNPESAYMIEYEMKAKFELKDYPGADSLAQRLLLTGKTSLNFYYKGMTEYYLRKYVEGINHLSTAIKMDSSFRDAWYYRGLTYFAMNDELHACQDMRKAKKLGYPGFDNKIDLYCKDIKE
jgi:tetratricopeptide (TPR) repeat protein